MRDVAEHGKHVGTVVLFLHPIINNQILAHDIALARVIECGS
jgi:hypothetical protein